MNNLADGFFLIWASGRSLPSMPLSAGFKVDEGEEVFDFLQDRGVDLNTIEAIVWSHHHGDHIGNPAGFPATTGLIAGPGFKENSLPGCPANPQGRILESDYKGRSPRQIDFDEESKGLTIGGFRALDYFGDGSFYLLETPGHPIDHLVGLARTSVSPPGFIIMGADLAHHPSMFRPTQMLPLPKELEPSPFGANSPLNVRSNVCPGALFVDHVHPEHSDRTPFRRIKAGLPYNVNTARDAVKALQKFDEDERILVIIAHDHTMLPYLSFWPQEANGWHGAKWKDLSRWHFLKDFTGIARARMSA